jgi:hypothetical protein
MFLNKGYLKEYKDGKIKGVHTTVAEEKLGRKLGKHEVVHHKDGNKLNNDPDNLIVLRHTRDHTVLHNSNNKGLEVFETKDGSCVVVKDQVVCEYCGGLFVPDALHTRYCTIECGARATFNKQSKALHTVDPNMLAQQVWEIPSTKLADMYGVSDSAINKWCRKFDIEKPPRGYWTKKNAQL